MSVMGYNYQQERTFNILDKATTNEGRSAGIMNAGLGIGMGLNIGNMVGGAMTNVVNTDTISPSVKKNLVCSSCGSEVPEGAKFRSSSRFV